ncbi:MAG: hypothetical protein K2K57_04905 [Oscillospiraceae bacterium]|nr:hypothetical protein [Oscillospiraceae bacterium]
MSIYERFADLWEKISAKAKELFSRLKDSKRGLYLCAGLGLCAMLMILLGDGGKEEVSEVTDSELSEEALSEEDFIRRTEDELEGILCAIDGVGDTKVMVTAKGSREYVYAENESERKEERDHVILKNGSKEEALVKTVNAPKITGVVVVCEGGGSDRVKEEVVRAVTAALGIPSGSVHVSKMK